MRRLLTRGLLSILTLGLFVCLAFAADTYQVVRNVRLLTKPSSTSGQRIKTLHQSELVVRVGGAQVGEYIKVRDGAGDVGWVYEPFLTEEPEIESAGGGTAPVVPVAPTSGELSNASRFAIPNCPPEGNPSPRGSRFEVLKALNRLKNRTLGPAGGAVQSVGISAFLAPGDDEQRWRTDQAVEIVAYVADVKSGGAETCNCKSDDERYYDTHIELTSGPSSRMLPLIVEVTPAWRGLMATAGKDWSTDGLEASIEHQWVRVRGWLFWDGEHRHNAENTNPDGDQLWRRTAWEIHPVTAIEAAPIP